MASLGHIAVGLAAGRGCGGDSWRRTALAFSALSMWPDADVVGFAVGVRYGDTWGHRGATHSIALALVAGLVCYVLAHRSRRVLAFATLVALSHPLLDTMTFGGGLGCALLWPLTDERFWAPVRFIPVAPIGLGMATARGLRVAAQEAVLFAPFWLYAVWPRRRTG